MKSRRALHLIFNNCSEQSGFTAIEIIIAIGLLALLTGLGLFLSFDFYRGYSFRYEERMLISMLQKARSMAINNIEQMPHGVRFETDHYIFFRGSAYDIHDPQNATIPFGTGVTATGTVQFIFQQLSGNTSTGTIRLTDGTKNADITINNEGAIIW